MSISSSSTYQKNFSHRHKEPRKWLSTLEQMWQWARVHLIAALWAAKALARGRGRALMGSIFRQFQVFLWLGTDGWGHNLDPFIVLLVGGLCARLALCCVFASDVRLFRHPPMTFFPNLASSLSINPDSDARGFLAKPVGRSLGPCRSHKQKSSMPALLQDQLRYSIELATNITGLSGIIWPHQGGELWCLLLLLLLLYD